MKGLHQELKQIIEQEKASKQEKEDKSAQRKAAKQRVAASERGDEGTYASRYVDVDPETRALADQLICRFNHAFTGIVPNNLLDEDEMPKGVLKAEFRGSDSLKTTVLVNEDQTVQIRRKSVNLALVLDPDNSRGYQLVKGQKEMSTEKLRGILEEVNNQITEGTLTFRLSAQKAFKSPGGITSKATTAVNADNIAHPYDPIFGVSRGTRRPVDYTAAREALDMDHDI